MMRDDTISRAAAIDALADYIHNVDRVYSTGKLTHDDCMDVAHSVLDKLPSAQPVAKDINVSVKDCISRQAAIDALAEWNDAAITNRLNNLPSAQQWIPCSECKKRCEKWEHLKT